MAIAKTAACLIVTGIAWAQALQFPVRHQHWRGGCDGIMTVDKNAISFRGAASGEQGTNDHAWTWKFYDIQELQLAPRSIRILTYKDSKLKLGSGRSYEFSGGIPSDSLYAFLRDRMDQRFVAQMEERQEPGAANLMLEVKHHGRILGSERS